MADIFGVATVMYKTSGSGNDLSMSYNMNIMAWTVENTLILLKEKGSALKELQLRRGKRGNLRISF